MKSPTNVIETITPAKAREYLGWNTGNRRLRDQWVQTLAGLMLRGEWVLTHQGVAFDETGRLVDGQHRLHAVVEANKPMQMYVARGLSEAVYPHIDGGAVRFTSDRIKLTEDPDTNWHACAIVKFYLAIEGAKSIRGVGAKQISIDRIENEFLANTDGYTTIAAEWRRKVKGICKCAVGAAIACYWTHNPAMAETFMNKILSGADLSEGSPALALRQVLMTGTRVGTERQMYWKTIAACRAYNDGKKITNLTAAAEDFRGNRYRTITVERAEKGRRVSATVKRKQAIASLAAPEVSAMLGERFAKATRRGSR